MASLSLLHCTPSSSSSSSYACLSSSHAQVFSPSRSAHLRHVLTFPSSSPSSSVNLIAVYAASSSSLDLLNSRSDSSSSNNDDSFGSSLFGSLTDVVSPPVEPKPAVECPPGLCRYETMAVLRPDITEEDRLQLTQRYEEAIIASGGMGVEVFNRGMMPLAYNIRKKDMSGNSNRYLDGVYFLFTYCAKPKSLENIQKRFNTDDDVIRSSTFKVKPVRSS